MPRAVTAPRIIVSGATTALTRRTTLRKAFLAPFHPLVEQCWLYALADAQQLTDVAVHHSVLMVSHHHTSVTPSSDNLSVFVRHFHRELSCALNTLLCAERYDAPRELFDARETHMMRLVDAAAQASHLVYERLNPCAAGLVQRPEHMPLRSLDFELWKTGYLEVERPPVYFDSSRPERLRLRLTPPPLLYRAFGGDLERLVYHMNRLVDEGLQAIRAVRKRPVMGAEALRRLHPWSEPRTLREAGGGPVPTFKIGARGIVARATRIGAAHEVHGFRAEHARVRIARRNGDTEARYPFGTYGARVYYGAPVEPAPAPDALIAQPGPLLCDVVRELERERRGEAERGECQAMVREVREALCDEAAEIVEEAELDLVEPAPRSAVSIGAGKADAAGDGERAPAVVRHRFDERQPEPACRLITLRDRRRGRPPGGGTHHGSDPPV
jgi:hypothetical protein